jgi:hypothetical protein
VAEGVTMSARIVKLDVLKLLPEWCRPRIAAALEAQARWQALREELESDLRAEPWLDFDDVLAKMARLEREGGGE